MGITFNMRFDLNAISNTRPPVDRHRDKSIGFISCVPLGCSCLLSPMLGGFSLDNNLPIPETAGRVPLWYSVWTELQSPNSLLTQKQQETEQECLHKQETDRLPQFLKRLFRNLLLCLNSWKFFTQKFNLNSQQLTVEWNGPSASSASNIPHQLQSGWRNWQSVGEGFQFTSETCTQCRRHKTVVSLKQWPSVLLVACRSTQYCHCLLLTKRPVYMETSLVAVYRRRVGVQQTDASRAACFLCVRQFSFQHFKRSLDNTPNSLTIPSSPWPAGRGFSSSALSL